jgi:hypothetical protein
MKRYFVLLFVFFVGFSSVWGQTSDYRIQTVFLSNFIKQIQWPASTSATEFVVGVYSNKQVTNILSERLSKIPAPGDKKVVVINLSGVEQLSSCDMLFIPVTSRLDINNISKNFVSKPLLIVTEKEGALGKGSDINLTLVNNQPRYELSEANLEKKGLRASAYLIKMNLTR